MAWIARITGGMSMAWLFCGLAAAAALVVFVRRASRGAYFGAQAKQGIELALDELNKAGVNGFKFEIQYEDSACSPLPATQAAKRLLDQYKPDIVIGEECSDATLAVMPVLAQAKVPL